MLQVFPGPLMTDTDLELTGLSSGLSPEVTNMVTISPWSWTYLFSIGLSFFPGIRCWGGGGRRQCVAAKLDTHRLQKTQDKSYLCSYPCQSF